METILLLFQNLRSERSFGYFSATLHKVWTLKLQVIMMKSAQLIAVVVIFVQFSSSASINNTTPFTCAVLPTANGTVQWCSCSSGKHGQCQTSCRSGQSCGGKNECENTPSTPICCAF